MADSADHPSPERKRPAHLPAFEHHNRAIIQFVTVCTQDRRPLLANPAAHAVLLAAFQAATWYRVGRYVIMPGHVHLFCAPSTHPPEPLTRWISFWKSHSARHWPGHGGAKLWQRDSWDTQLRATDHYGAKWTYVRENPVRAGLVAHADAWPYQGELNILSWHD
jgi:putative transposase